MNELLNANYKTIREIDDKVNGGWNAFIEYEKNHPPHSEAGRKYNAIGVIRALMTIVDENYYRFRKPKPLKMDNYIKYRNLVKN